MRRPVDLRSDTVTQPTRGMWEAMRQAELGDDVFEDDPTIRRLEATAAERLGKEAGLFVASGTMANQVALMTHTQRGNEVICGLPCHIQEHEVGACAVLSGATLVTVPAPTGVLEPEHVRRAIRTPDVHHPETGLVCLECAHSSGAVQPVEALRRVEAVAGAHGLPVHLDGARIFNAAACLGVDPAELASGATSVMFCLSKGLGAPVGSVLCGQAEFIARARRQRKLLGGGMRQVGLLGAAGLYALRHHVGRLLEDHRRAAVLGEALRRIPGVTLFEDRLDINMVWFSYDHPAPDAVVAALAERQVKILGPLGGEWRLVTHLDIDDDDLAFAIDQLRAVFGRGKGSAS